MKPRAKARGHVGAANEAPEGRQSAGIFRPSGARFTSDVNPTADAVGYILAAALRLRKAALVRHIAKLGEKCRLVRG